MLKTEDPVKGALQYIGIITGQVNLKILMDIVLLHTNLLF